MAHDNELSPRAPADSPPQPKPPLRGRPIGDATAEALLGGIPARPAPHHEVLTPEQLAPAFPQLEILGLLGCGGMGAVYKARQTALDRFVALKLLPHSLGADPEFNLRFQREARAMARLSHPNIVTIHDFGETPDGRPYLIMEFVEGTNLHDLIRSSALEGSAPSLPRPGIDGAMPSTPGLDARQALAITAQVCDALAYAHGEGVVHRDIKPANVMVDLRGRVKVADFGLARLVGGEVESGLTMTGTVMGTLDYMAPEQRRGEAVDHRADIYALGIVLYEMLCREVPHGMFDPPSSKIGCDPRIDRIVATAMQSEPERRFQSTHEMHAAVEAARTAVLAPVPAPPRALAPPRPPRPPVPARSVGGTPAVLEPVLRTGSDVRLLPGGSPRRRYTAFSIIALVLLAGVSTMLWRKKSTDPLTDGRSATPAAAAMERIVSVPGLPDLPPLHIPPGEPGLVKQFDLPGPFLGEIKLLPDSRRLLVFFDRGLVKLIDLETEAPVWAKTLDQRQAISISADGSRFATIELQDSDGKPLGSNKVSSEPKAAISLWRTADASLVQRWITPHRAIGNGSVLGDSLALSPSGRRIVARVGAVGPAPFTTSLVAFEDGKEEPVHEWAVTDHLAVTTHALDDERYLSVGNGPGVVLRFTQPEKIERVSSSGLEFGGGPSPDRRWFIANDWSAKASAVWDTASFTRVCFLEHPLWLGIRRFAGNDLVLIAGSTSQQIPGNVHLRVWDRGTGKQLAAFQQTEPDHLFGGLEGAANGSFCVTRLRLYPVPKSGDPNTLQIWRLPKPGAVATHQ